MFSSRKIFLIEDWFDYAMVTANLKFTKKKTKKNNPVLRSKSLSNEKKTDTLKKTKQNTINKEENKKNKTNIN